MNYNHLSKFRSRSLNGSSLNSLHSLTSLTHASLTHMKLRTHCTGTQLDWLSLTHSLTGLTSLTQITHSLTSPTHCIHPWLTARATYSASEVDTELHRKLLHSPASLPKRQVTFTTVFCHDVLTLQVTCPVPVHSPPLPQPS